MSDVLTLIDWSDPRLWWTAGVALVAGLVRGFTGFGAGMIFIPAVSAIYDPVTAIVLLFLIDSTAILPMMPRHFRACRWREVGPVSLAASAAFPFGLAVLLRIDPFVTRWILSLFVLAIVAALALGLRYRGEPRIGHSLAVGGAMGLLSGAIGLGGPIIVIFWLGGPERAARVRSNILAFFGLFSVVTGIGYGMAGLFTPERLLGALVLLPLYGIPLVLGSRLFDRSTEAGYRRAALALCGLTAVAAMPVWR